VDPAVGDGWPGRASTISAHPCRPRRKRCGLDPVLFSQPGNVGVVADAVEPFEHGREVLAGLADLLDGNGDELDLAPRGAAEDSRRLGHRTLELLAFAAEGSPALPVIVGVSEGAGLGVLAATDPAVQALVEGVVGLGLPDQNELGWRFRDSIIYLTKKAPKEPGFLVSRLIAGVAPVPLAMIHSTRDEFVPLEEAQRLYGLARDPRRLWVIDAADHRFRDKPQELAACLAEALDWVVSARGAGR